MPTRVETVVKHIENVTQSLEHNSSMLSKLENGLAAQTGLVNKVNDMHDAVNNQHDNIVSKLDNIQQHTK
jgi:DNA repair ATPase RecN